MKNIWWSIINIIKKAAFNTIIIAAGDVIYRILSLIITIYLARYFGALDYGNYIFIFVFISFFGDLTDLGLKTILLREISREKTSASKLLGNSLVIKLFSSIFAIGLVTSLIGFSSYSDDIKFYVFLASFILLFQSLSDLYYPLFQANLKMEYNTISRIVSRAFSLGIIFSIIFLRGSLFHVVIVLVVAEFIRMLITYLFSRKFVKTRMQFDLKIWKYLLKESLPIAFSSAILVIYLQINVVILSFLEGNASVGIFSAASRLQETLVFIPLSLMGSVFPMMSNYFVSSKEKLTKSYRLSFKYILLITLPITMVVTVLADKIIFLIYGNQFFDSISILQIIIWSFIFSSLNFVLITLLISMNKQKLNLIISGFSAILSIILNFVLISKFGGNGAAMASLITNIVFFLFCFYFVSKNLYTLPVHKIFTKPIICAIIMYLFLYYFNNLNIILLVILSVIVYLASLIISKTFSNEDISIIKEIIGKK